MAGLRVFFGLLFLVGFAHGTEEAVHTLTEKNFDEFLKEHEVSLIEFYAPWCGHCKSLAPEYEKAAQTLKAKGSIPLGKVDATENKELQSRFQIKGFPTLKIFRKGEPEEYRGGRTAESIVSYVEQVTGPAVEVAKSQEELDKLSKGQTVVYIGHFGDIEGEQHDTFAKVADSHRTKGKFIAYVHADTSKHGEVHAVRQDEEPATHAISTHDTLKNFILQEFFPLFGPISGENYNDYSQRDLEMVWYCGGKDDFEKVAKIVRSVASGYRDTYSFVWLDSEQFGSHAEGALGISEFPGLVLQSKKGRYVYPSKELESHDVLKKFFEDVASGKLKRSIKSEEIPEKNDEPVKVVVANTFDEIVFQADKDVLLEVYAPWCGHCKKLEPIYDEFAESLIKGGVKHVVVAKMDGTANEATSDEFEWSGFPTLFFVKAGETKPLRYDGARTVEGLTEFIKKKSSKEVLLKEEDVEVKEEL